MAYCRNCGNEIHDQAVVCPACGVGQKQVVDNGGIGFGLLGCCIPLAGLVLFLIWKDEKPKTAKSCIIGAGTGLGLIILMYVLLFFIGIAGAM